MADEECSSIMSQVPSAQRPYFIAGFTIISISAATLNCFVLYVFVRSKSLQSFANCLYISLVLSDLLVGTALSPISILQLALASEKQSCAIKTISNALVNLLAITALTVCVIAFDRFKRVSKDQNYDAFMTRKRRICLLLFPWIIPFFLIPVRYLGDSIYTYSVFVAYVAGYGLILFSYLRLIRFLRAREQERIENDNRAHPAPVQQQRTLKQNQRATYLIFLLIACFVPCSLGTFIYRIIATIHHNTDGGISLYRHHAPTIMTTGQLMFQFNSILNPFLYYAKHYEVRRAIRMMPCLRRQRGISIEPNGPNP